jgi:hypothetical protein
MSTLLVRTLCEHRDGLGASNSVCHVYCGQTLVGSHVDQCDASLGCHHLHQRKDHLGVGKVSSEQESENCDAKAYHAVAFARCKM